MRKLVLGLIASLAVYEFAALLTRVRTPNRYEEARLMRLRKLGTTPADECWFHGLYPNPQGLEMDCPECHHG